jgi:hypothetical protein
MRVGFDPNQQGHAFEHVQASSSCPVSFQGVLGGSARVDPSPKPIESHASKATADTIAML